MRSFKMVRGKLKLLATFFLLSLSSEFVAAGKSEVFRITSNVTMQRKWKTNFLKDTGEGKSLTSRLDDILYPYLQSTNEDEAIQTRELTEKVEILNLKDVYINTCDSQILLQNVNYTDLNSFYSSPVEVDTKISEISNQRTVQIVGSIKTNVMTLHGEMIFQDSIYYFTANLTNPTFHAEKNISQQMSLNSGPTTEGQLENFSFEDFTISIHPKDMHSVTLKKLELRTSILQRLADTWLPVIATHMNNLLLPKMKQHEKLLTKDSDHRKLLIKNVCDLISQYYETNTSSYSSYSTILKGLSNFSHCGGDAMVVKKYTSSDVYNFRHNISILLNYNQSGLLIATESDSITTTYETPTTRTTPYYYTRRGYYNEDSYSAPKPTPEPACKKIYINNIAATMSFELEMGETKVQRILQTDLDFSVDTSSMKGCTYATMMTHIKSYFNQKLQEYLNHVGE